MSYLHASASPAAQSLVLIAEDEAEIADILAAYLQRHGLRTLHAADGSEALYGRGWYFADGMMEEINEDEDVLPLR